MTDLLDFDALECHVSQSKETPLSAIIIGQTHSGKSTTAGTFVGKNILYITTPSEVHGFRNAVKMNEEKSKTKGTTPSKFIHVNIGVVQALDKKLNAPYSEDLEVGSALPPEAQVTKLWFTLECFKCITVDVVVVDSLSNMYDVFTSSTECQRACLSDKGSYNTFKEYQVVGNMYSRLSTVLDEFNSRGVATVCTCLAKMDNFVEKAGAVVPTSFVPDLPSVNVARTLLARFETTILQYRNPSYKNNQPHFSFNIKGSKVSRSREDATKIVNAMEVDLRCQYLPLGYGLSRLPPDLEDLKKNVEAFVRATDKAMKEEAEAKAVSK